MRESERGGAELWERDHHLRVVVPGRNTRELGRCIAGSIDDVSEALAVAEGETFR